MTDLSSKVNIVMKLLFLLVLLNYLMLSYSFKDGKIVDHPIILSWYSEQPKARLKTCGNHKCLLSGDRKLLPYPNLAVILFYASAFNPNDLPLPRDGKTWAIYHEESSRNAPWLMYDHSQRLFNVTATFSRHSEFPITFDGVDLGMIKTAKYYVPLTVKNKLEIAPILYMQSICENPIQRDSYVLELMEYIKVDSYGFCLNNKRLPKELEIRDQTYHNDREELLRFIAQYKFIITIENSVCDDYISEKIWKAITVGSVPIYLGSPTIKEWLPNPDSAIIISDFLNPKELAEFIHKVNKNDTLYLRYMQHKISIDKKVTNTKLIQALPEDNNVLMEDKFMCFLCTNAYEAIQYKARNQSVMNCVSHGTGIWSKLYRNGKCEALVLDEFINKLKLSNYTLYEFNKRVQELKEARYC